MPVFWFPQFSFQPGLFFFVCVISWCPVLWKSMISAQMLSKCSFLVLCMDFFNYFLVFCSSSLYDSLFKLFHCLRSCLLLIISSIILGSFVFLLTFWTKSLAVPRYRFRDIVPLQFHIPTFTFDCRIFLLSIST
jgi:hypothetical protein